MLSLKKVLSMQSLNPRVKGTKRPLLEHLAKRAEELQQDLRQDGESRPFSEILECHVDDLYNMGQKPITFIQQVTAICAYPELLKSTGLPEDAKQRAQSILKELDGSNIGCYNLGYMGYSIPEKVAKFIERRDGGIPSNPRNIVAFSGASQSIMCFMTMVSTKDEALKTGVLVPVPHDPVYTNALVLTDAVKVPYQLDEGRDWVLNIQELRRALQEGRKYCNPKVLCIINPGNPTGQVQSRKCIEDVIKFAAEENLLLYADEVLQDSVFGTECTFHSLKKVLFEMGPRYSATVQLISCFAITQGYIGACGLRAGYIEHVNIDPLVMDCIPKIVSLSHPSVLGQIAMNVLLSPPCPEDTSYDSFMEEKQRALDSLAENALLTEEMFHQTPGIYCKPIQGSIYAFPRIDIPEKAVKRAQDQGMVPDVFFCYKLLEETGIFLAAGSAFGQVEGPHHFRLTLLPPKEKLKMILKSIKDFHEKFLQEYS